MKAAYIEHPGPPETIVYGDVAQPEPQGAQVLVRVHAVDVNPIDTYIRSGMIKAELPRPYILGCDLAGTVEAIGPEVRRFRPGDRVWGCNQGLMGRQGTFAEYAAVDERWLYPTPAGVSDRDAVATSLVGITAHLGLFGKAQVKAGETVFVRGGTGGVGSCVVQMARVAGARVITTAGSDEKVQIARRLGADEVIAYKSEDLDEALTRLASSGVDVWWETLREPDFDLTISHLALRGRMILMAGREARPSFPVGPFYTRDCSVHGFAMFNASPDQQRQAADDISRWQAEDRLHAQIDRVLPLSEAAAAHRLQEENTIQNRGTLTGKIVLEL